jgi:hypothetical protein
MAYDTLPNDAPGDDCPEHGPYADDECPKCLLDRDD